MPGDGDDLAGCPLYNGPSGMGKEKRKDPTHSANYGLPLQEDARVSASSAS